MPRTKINAMLISKNNTEKLIEIVRENPELYDASLSDYKDTLVIKNIWSSVAKEMKIQDLTADDVKVRWRTIRDTYVKKRREISSKKKSGSAAQTAVRWPYMEVLSFLDPFIKEASTDSNMDFLEQVEEGVCPSNMDDQGQESRNDVTDQSSVIQSPSPSPRETPPNSVYVEESTFKNPTESRRPKKTKKCTDSMTEFETSFLEIAKAQASRLNTLEYEQPKRDAVDAFYESCALRTKQLPKNKQLWLQMQVSMLLYTSETSDSLPPFMPYPCQTHHSYPHQQAYNLNQLPIPEYTNQQGSGLSGIAYNKNDFSAGNENSSQITHTTGLDILSEAMQSLQ